MDIKVVVVGGDWPDKGEPVAWLRTGPGGDHQQWPPAMTTERFIPLRINNVPDDFDICEGICTGKFDTTPSKRGLDLLPEVIRRWRLPAALVDLISGEGKQREVTLDDFEDRKV